MALADAVQGAKRPGQVITWTEGDGDPVDLTGASIAGRIYSDQTGEARDIDGTITPVDEANGVFRWDYGDNDVSEAGLFLVQFVASFPNGPSPSRTIAQAWVVHESL